MTFDRSFAKYSIRWGTIDISLYDYRGLWQCHFLGQVRGNGVKWTCLLSLLGGRRLWDDVRFVARSPTRGRCWTRRWTTSKRPRDRRRNPVTSALDECVAEFEEGQILWQRGMAQATRDGVARVRCLTCEGLLLYFSMQLSVRGFGRRDMWL